MMIGAMLQRSAEECVAQGALRGSPDDRAEAREEVYHRTRATLTDRRQLSVLVVNISASGLMLRSDATVSVGEWIRVWLPGVGEMTAAVRWALGGRIGCQFDQPIPMTKFHGVLGALGR
jgi:hypothetical protein